MMSRPPSDPAPADAGERLRTLMDTTCVAMPGAFNALCAQMIRDAGFEACYISGAATSVSAGVPDIGVLSLDHFVRTIREAAEASGLPIIADADTGFGEAEMVRRTVLEYCRAGAAGLHIEDQVFPKRCGHLDGKTLLPTDVAAEKIAWAAQASQDCSNGSFIICARTDARGVDGLDAAIERAHAYINAGAHMIFPEGLATEHEFETFAEAMAGIGPRPPYLLANMTEFGKTPMIPVPRFAEMGYACVIFPVTLLRIAMGAVRDSLRTLHETGTAESLLPVMQTRAELYQTIRYTPGQPWSWPTHAAITPPCC